MANPVIMWLRWRIKHKKGNNIIVCGEPGSGKSRRGIRLGELLDLNGFNREKITYSGESFLHYLINFVKKGDAVMWDENIGADAADWYTESNKAIKRSMQVMRKKEFTFIQCLPSLEDLDPKVRKYFHVYVEPKYFDSKLDGYWCIMMRIQHNPRNKKTYFKYFRFQNKKSGRVFVITQIFIRNPRNQELTLDYEETSDKIKNEVHKESEKIIKIEKENNKRNWAAPVDITEHVVTVKANIDSCISQFYNSKYLDKHKISTLCQVGLETAARIKKKIENEGRSL